MSHASLIALVLMAGSPPATAQDRDAKVRGDRDAFADSLDWIYNDIGEAFAAARMQGKPLMVVVRCIPCEACQEFDDDVARRDPIIRDLMDRFVCVRIVQANTLDLALFQYDFDLSMAIVFLHPDGTALGRFGTRSARFETEDISLIGLRHAMQECLRLSESIDEVRPALEGKQPRPVTYKTPLEYPTLAGRYGAVLEYQGEVAKSCVHCHQVREAERHVYRDAGEPIPDEVLFPYPDPEVLGLRIDPRTLVAVERVEPGSIADRAGIAEGDRIATLDGQPLLSTADLQWVLHQTPSSPASLRAVLERDGGRREVTMELPADWRRRGDLSWRVTTWDLRRTGLGGMKLRDLDDGRRDELGLPRRGMALLIDHVGQFGQHAVAKRAGLLAGDVIVGFDGLDDRLTETDLIAYAVQQKRVGDRVEIDILRDGNRRRIAMELP